MLREVRLYGDLGRRFGRVHRYDVRTAAEAVRALSANHRDFVPYVLQHDRPGYRVITDAGRIGAEQLRDPSAGRILLVPVIAGAGKGIGEIIFGAVLIGASFYLPEGTLFKVGGLSITAGTVAGVGVNLALSGISQLLSPTPKAPQPPDRPDNKPSFAFDGAVNVAAQGNPVPIGYGRMIVGSVVISSGLHAEPLSGS